MSERCYGAISCVDPLWCLQRRLCKVCWDQAGEAIRQEDEAAAMAPDQDHSYPERP